MKLNRNIGELLQELAVQHVGSFPLFDVIDALPAAIYTTDAHGKIDIYNEAATELWGRAPDGSDEYWCGSWKLYHPDGREMPHNACPMAEALRTGKAIRGREAIAERPDGTRINFVPYPTPIKDEQGKVVGGINMLVDITDRKRSEEALARSEAKLRDFVETAAIGLHWVGPDGTILWANAAEMNMLGYTADEYIGRHIAEFHADSDLIEDILARLSKFEIIRDCEARLRCKDGSIRHVVINSSVYAEAGVFVHSRCFTQDVTSQKIAEQQLEIRIQQLHAISELGMSALASDDLDAIFRLAVEKLSAGLGVDYAKILELRPDKQLLLREGVGWHDGAVGQARVGAGLDSQAGYTLYVAQPVIVADLNTETRFSGPPLLHDHGVVSGLSTIIRGKNGAPFGVLGAHSRTRRQFSRNDVHFLQSVANVLGGAIEKQAYRETQQMLRHELSHRFKNNLSVVMGMARMTARSSDSFETFMESFENRLSALAQTQHILVGSNWSGSGLCNLLHTSLEGQVAKQSIHIDVEDIKLNADCTQAVSMVIHELLTNAIKYGALSDTAGTVSIIGKQDHTGDSPLYCLTWTERGGPPPEVPSSLGFGNRILKWTVEDRFRGEFTMDWRREGLCVDIVLPLASLNAPSGQSDHTS